MRFSTTEDMKLVEGMLSVSRRRTELLLLVVLLVTAVGVASDVVELADVMAVPLMGAVVASKLLLNAADKMLLVVSVPLLPAGVST